MSQPRSAASLEIEIQTLLDHFQTADLAADALIKKYESQKLNLSEFETVATFLLYCGFYATLTDLILRKLDDGSQIPWGHFVEAIFLSSEEVPQEIREALLHGAEENKSLSHLSRSHNLDGLEPELPKIRTLRREGFAQIWQEKKQELLQEIAVLKSQGLFQEEEKVIQKIAVYFPQDEQVFQLRADLRERLARDYISKKTDKPKKKTYFPVFEKRSHEEENLLHDIEQAMQESLKSSQDLAVDFALAHILWDNHEAALRILKNAPDSPDVDWLRAEALLRGRRFVELLEDLVDIEQKYASDAETIFATHYLRAQALWGLDQKRLAIEILEGMVEARPHYRAAASLLREWKEDLA